MLKYKNQHPIDVNIITDSIQKVSSGTNEIVSYGLNKVDSQSNPDNYTDSVSSSSDRFYSSQYSPIALSEIDYELISKAISSEVKIADNRYADSSFVLSKLGGVNPLRPEIVSLHPIDTESIEKWNSNINYFVESSDILRKFLKVSAYSRNFRNSRISRVFNVLKNIEGTKKLIEESNSEFISNLSDAKKAIDFVIGLFKSVDEFDDIYILDEHKIDSRFFVQDKNNGESSSGFVGLKELFFEAGYSLDAYNRISNTKKFLYALELVENSLIYFPGLFLGKQKSYQDQNQNSLYNLYTPNKFKQLKNKIDTFIDSEIPTAFGTSSEENLIKIFQKISDFNLSERDSIVATCLLLGKDLSSSYAMGNVELSNLMNTIHGSDEFVNFESSGKSILSKTINSFGVLSSTTRDINLSLSDVSNSKSVGTSVFFIDKNINKTVYKLDKYFSGSDISDYRISGYDYYLSSIMNPKTFLDSSVLKSGYGTLSKNVIDACSISDILIGNSKNPSEKQANIHPKKLFKGMLTIAKEFLSLTKEDFNIGVKLIGLLRSLKNDYTSSTSTSVTGDAGVKYKSQLFKYFILKNISRNAEADSKTQKKEFFEFLSLVYNTTPGQSVDVSPDSVQNYLDLNGVKSIFPFYDKVQHELSFGADAGFSVLGTGYEYIDWTKLIIEEKETQLNDQSDPFKALGSFLADVHDSLEKYYFYDGVSNKVYTKYLRLEFIKYAALVFEMFVDFISYLDMEISIKLRNETSLFFNALTADRYHVAIKYATIVAAHDAIDEYLKKDGDVNIDDPAFQIRQIQQEKLESIADLRLTVENEKLYAQYFRSNIKKIQELDKMIEREFLFTDKLVGFLKSFGQSVNDKLSVLSNYISSSGPNGDIIQFVKNENTSSNLINNWIYGFGGHQIRLSRNIYNRIVDFYNIDFKNTEGFSSSYVLNPSISEKEEEILHKLIDSKDFIGLDKSPKRLLTFGLPIGFSSNVDQMESSAQFKFFESLNKSSSSLFEVSVYSRNMGLEGIVFKPLKFIFDLNLFIDKTKGFSDISSFKSIDDLVLKGVRYTDISNILEEKKNLGIEYMRDKRYTSVVSEDTIPQILKNHLYSEFYKTMIVLMSGFRMDESTFLINSNPLKSNNSNKFTKLVDTYIRSRINQGISLDQLVASNKTIAAIISRIENNEFSNAFLQKVRVETTGNQQNQFANQGLSDAFIEDMVDLSKMFSTDTWLFSPREIRDKILYPKSFDRVFTLGFSPYDFVVDISKSDQEALSRILRSDDYPVIEQRKDGEYIYTQMYKNTSRFFLEQYYIDVRLLD